MVFQNGDLVCTCPPDFSQYCSCSAADPDGDVELDDDEPGDELDASAEPDPPVDAEPRVDAVPDVAALVTAADEVLLAVALVSAEDPLDPHPASRISTRAELTATGSATGCATDLRLRLVLIAAPLPVAAAGRVIIIARRVTDSDPR